MRRLLGLASGGKDSLYSLFLAHHHSFDISALGTVKPREGTLLFHEPNVDLVKVHAELLGLPLLSVRGWEEEALRELLCKAKEIFDVRWVSTGALASDFQRLRFVWVASECGLKVYSPLWHLKPDRYLKKVVEDGFRFLIVSSGVYELRNWIGVEINRENVDELIELARKYNFNPAGEGGEYETFVTDAPFFPRRLIIKGRKEGWMFKITGVEAVDKG